MSRDGKDRFVDDEPFSFSTSRALDLFLELQHNIEMYIKDTYRINLMGIIFKNLNPVFQYTHHIFILKISLEC